jgi:hypothetical protein
MNDKIENPIARQLGGLPLKALIGAPLKAAADANGMMSRVQAQFILSTCFDKNEDGKLKPIMIEFMVERPLLDSDGRIKDEKVSMNIAIPLLTIIPLSSLAVEKMKISFDMNVSSSQVHSKETTKDMKESAGGQQSNLTKSKSSEFNVEMMGALAEKGDRKNTSSARYEIDLEAGTLPLPRGITTIIDIFTKNMTPLPSKN